MNSPAVLRAQHAEATAWARHLLDRVNQLQRSPTWDKAVQNLCDLPDTQAPDDRLNS